MWIYWHRLSGITFSFVIFRVNRWTKNKKAYNCRLFVYGLFYKINPKIGQPSHLFHSRERSDFEVLET